MTNGLPPRFVDLYHAYCNPGREFNVMGRATDILAPSRSRGTDWMFTFSLTDPTMGGEFFNEGVKVRFFRKSEGELPPVQDIGDIIMLRNLKITEYQGMRMGISCSNTRWAVFPRRNFPGTSSIERSYPKFIKDPKDVSPSEAEIHYALELYHQGPKSPSVTSSATDSISSAQQSNSSAGTSVSPPSSSWPVVSKATLRRDKFSLIKDLKADTYYDLTGQVVKMYPGNGIVEIYVSDYTSNQLLFDYKLGSGADRDNSLYDRKWPGPFGKHTLTVTLWPPHSDFAQNSVEENDLVSLRNVHVKWSKGGKLEGVIHTDRMNTDRLGISVINGTQKENDAKVKDLLRRKFEYKRGLEKSVKNAEATARGQKRKAAGDGRPLSKTSARKRRKEEKLAVNTKKMLQSSEFEESDSGIAGEQRGKKRSGCRTKKGTEVLRAHRDLNKNVKSSYSSIPTLTISKILARDESHLVSPPTGDPYLLPFQNVKTRATVRVVDYFPKELADFSKPVTDSSELDGLSDVERDATSDIDSLSIPHTPERLTKWEWRFGLVLEDASTFQSAGQKPRLKVFLAAEDADFLLKLDATDLRADPQSLDELKEKLFLLWGDLEEQKTAAYESAKANIGQAEDRLTQQINITSRGRPFECCLMEYGTKVNDDDDDDEVPETTNAGDGKAKQCIGKDWKRRWRLFGTTIV